MKQDMPDHFSSHTVLGFDFGTKRIGAAVGQTITCTARALQQINRINHIPDWPVITRLIKEWKPFALIVGHPLNIDGSSQEITVLALSFAQDLKSRYDLPVYSIDERLSTVEAKAQLFEKGGYRLLSKKKIDMQAAEVILQEWLNSFSQ